MTCHYCGRKHLPYLPFFLTLLRCQHEQMMFFIVIVVITIFIIATSPSAICAGNRLSLSSRFSSRIILWRRKRLLPLGVQQFDSYLSISLEGPCGRFWGPEAFACLPVCLFAWRYCRFTAVWNLVCMQEWQVGASSSRCEEKKGERQVKVLRVNEWNERLLMNSKRPPPHSVSQTLFT